jgi:hypothetical protein
MGILTKKKYIFEAKGYRISVYANDKKGAAEFIKKQMGKNVKVKFIKLEENDNWKIVNSFSAYQIGGL